MDIQLCFNTKSHTSEELIVISAFSKKEKVGKKESTILVNSSWPKEWKTTFSNINSAKNFKGEKGTSYFFNLDNGTSVLALGLGDKSKYDIEALRRAIANLYKQTKATTTDLSIALDTFLVKGKMEESVHAIGESLGMTSYAFDTYKAAKNKPQLKTVYLDTSAKTAGKKKAQAALDNAAHLTDAINFGRQLVNEPPNKLNSETYAKKIEADAKKLKRVKVKVLGKAELKKEKMGMFLSVNAGSAFDPKLVHLTYTPSKVTKKTKHISFVGKGLTFDTGGYSLKPAGSIINMKFDMAGSATVYAAFRAAAALNLDVKISCYLGMTDNAINEHATMPDSIVTARNGKTVEVLNTDAEGRLVLGDVLNYACEQKPDALIDCATLTGAVLVSLGHEVCGVMGNNQKLIDSILKASKNTGEYSWQLPIIEEFRSDMKSPNADLKNIGGSRFGGSSKAAAFLENFVDPDIAWAHLDIAGIGDSQGHLPYCPAKGASGIMVRSLVNYLQNAK